MKIVVCLVALALTVAASVMTADAGTSCTSRRVGSTTYTNCW
jgi:hypothetical protein